MKRHSFGARITSRADGYRGRVRFATLVAAVTLLRPMDARSQPPVKVRVEPYLASLFRDYPVLGLAVRLQRVADSTARFPHSFEALGSGGPSLKGGFRTQIAVRAPGLGSRTRLVVLGGVHRDARVLFTGLGNAADFDRSVEQDGRRDWYTVRRHRATFRAEATRWMRPGWGLAFAGSADRASFWAPDGESIFQSTHGNRLEETDFAIGVTLVLDRRDREGTTKRGLLVQVGGAAGSGGDGYRRGFAAVQGYRPIGQATVVVGRLIVAGLTKGAPLVARYEVPLWERPAPVFGGDDSHRGFSGQRLMGRDVIVGNLELRRDIAKVRGQTLVGIGFLDVGRVFEGEALALTALQASGGLGVAARGNRAWLGGALAAVGPDGIRVSLVSGWPF